jgi:hypothetical protein
MMNDRSAHVGTVVATIVGPPVIATAIVWASVWATGTYFPQLGAHETPSTVGQGSFDRRFELASHETPTVGQAPFDRRFEAVFAQMRANSEPAVKIELLENDLPAIPAIKEFTLKREAFPLPEE